MLIYPSVGTWMHIPDYAFEFGSHSIGTVFQRYMFSLVYFHLEEALPSGSRKSPNLG